MRTGKEWIEAIPYIGPSLIVLGIIAVFPILYAMAGSLTDWHLHRASSRTLVGLRNYFELFGDPRFLSSLSVTLLFTALSVLATMVFGFLLALLIQKPFRGKNLVRALLTIPMIMTPVVSALAWKVFFFEADIGLINWLLGGLGIRGPAWVATSPSAFFAVVLVDVWFMTPFVMLIMDAALAGLPPEPLDAAKIDGASYWQRVSHVIIPMIRGTIVFTLIFRITIDYRMFDIIYVMTAGGPAFDTQVLSIWVYNTALRTFEIGYANAGAVVMMFIIGTVCLAILILGLRKVGERVWSK